LSGAGPGNHGSPAWSRLDRIEGWWPTPAEDPEDLYDPWEPDREDDRDEVGREDGSDQGDDDGWGKDQT
jgi:hypothetical protein